MAVNFSEIYPANKNDSIFNFNQEDAVSLSTADLIASVNCHTRLDDPLREGISVGGIIECLYASASENDQDCIDLLVHFAAGEGEVADAAQFKLCQIVSWCEDDRLCRVASDKMAVTVANQEERIKAARATRDSCQSLLMLQESPLPNQDSASQNQSKPTIYADVDRKAKLLFAATVRVGNENNHADGVPGIIRDKVKALDSSKQAPGWFSPKGGVFSPISSDKIRDLDNFIRYDVAGDGSCLFRAIFASGADKDLSWAKCDKERVRAQLAEQGENQAKVKNAIAQACNNQHIRDEDISPRLKEALFSGDASVANRLFNETIASGKFSYYTPDGILLALGLKPKEKTRQDEHFLQLLCDVICENIVVGFGATVINNLDKPNGAEIYLFRRNEHYSLIAPKNYFS